MVLDADAPEDALVTVQNVKDIGIAAKAEVAND